MNVDYKSLNRNSDLSTAQKKALKKVFLAGEVAAHHGESELCSQILIHRAIGGWFSGDEKGDIQSLFKVIRKAIDTSDATCDISNVISSFRMDGGKRKLLRTMAVAVIGQIES